MRLMMHCHPGRTTSRVCQMARFSDCLVQEYFNLELQTTTGVRGVNGNRRFRTQEETVTETVLLKAEVNFPDVIAVETFTRHKETQTGADWFWILDFNGTLVPMLVQSKKIAEPWDGTENWTIEIDQSQRTTLQETAQNWNVGAQYCLYAPSIHFGHRFCGFPFPGGGFMHLLRPSQASKGTMAYHELAGELISFTCWCCCSHDAHDAKEVLGVSSEKFIEGENQTEKLISRARESENVRGAVVIKMGRDQ